MEGFTYWHSPSFVIHHFILSNLKNVCILMRFTGGWCPGSQTKLPLHSHVTHPLSELEPLEVNLLHRVKIARQQVNLKSRVIKCLKRWTTWSLHLLLEVIFDATLPLLVAGHQWVFCREWPLKILHIGRIKNDQNTIIILWIAAMKRRILNWHPQSFARHRRLRSGSRQRPWWSMLSRTQTNQLTKE